MKQITKRVLETLIRQEFEKSKHWPEKTTILIEAAEDLGFTELADELIRETF